MQIAAREPEALVCREITTSAELQKERIHIVYEVNRSGDDIHRSQDALQRHGLTAAVSEATSGVVVGS